MLADGRRREIIEQSLLCIKLLNVCYHSQGAFKLSLKSSLKSSALKEVIPVAGTIMPSTRKKSCRYCKLSVTRIYVEYMCFIWKILRVTGITSISEFVKLKIRIETIEYELELCEMDNFESSKLDKKQPNKKRSWLT